MKKKNKKGNVISAKLGKIHIFLLFVSISALLFSFFSGCAAEGDEKQQTQEGESWEDLSEFRKMAFSQPREFKEGENFEVVLHPHTLLVTDDNFSTVDPDIIKEVHDDRLVMNILTARIITARTPLYPMSEATELDLVPGDVLVGYAKKENLRKIEIFGIPVTLIDMALGISNPEIPDEIFFMRIVTAITKNPENEDEVIVWTVEAEFYEVFQKMKMKGELPLTAEETIFSPSDLTATYDVTAPVSETSPVPGTAPLLRSFTIEILGYGSPDNLQLSPPRVKPEYKKEFNIVDIGKSLVRPNEQSIVRLIVEAKFKGVIGVDIDWYIEKRISYYGKRFASILYNVFTADFKGAKEEVRKTIRGMLKINSMSAYIKPLLYGKALVEILKKGRYTLEIPIYEYPIWEKNFRVWVVPVFLDLTLDAKANITIELKKSGLRAGAYANVWGKMGYDAVNKKVILDGDKNYGPIKELNCPQGSVTGAVNIVPSAGIGVSMRKKIGSLAEEAERIVKFLEKTGYPKEKINRMRANIEFRKLTAKVGLIAIELPSGPFADLVVNMCGALEFGYGLRSNFEVKIHDAMIDILKSAKIISGDVQNPLYQKELYKLRKSIQLASFNVSICCPQEICDGKDNDGDGEVDEGFEKYYVYRDKDGDGVGDEKDKILSCKPAGTETPDPATGYVYDLTQAKYIRVDASLESGDCNDSDKNITRYTYYEDKDKDGYGNPEVSKKGCVQPQGYVTASADCNDSDASINPSAKELCDGIDNDCDGSVDEDFPELGKSCDGPDTDLCQEGKYVCSSDKKSVVCNDTTGNNTETCNEIDDDCDGQVDEGFDQDGDSYTSCGGDCDDSDSSVNPASKEVAGNGKDDDCNGRIDDDPFVSLGELHTCYTYEGMLVCFGWAEYGQLDAGTTGTHECDTYISGPDCITSPANLMESGILRVYSGSGNTCVINRNSELLCFGDNEYYQVGPSSTASTWSCFGATYNNCTTTPVSVTGSAVSAGVGLGHICFVDGSNTLWCRGRNDFGQLGQGHTNSTTDTVQVMQNVREISTLANHTCAIKQDGSLWCWGNNYYGQIGNGTSGDPVSSPTSVSSDAVQVSTGWYHTCIVNSSGQAFCWGGNQYGQLCLGDTTQRTSPEPVTTLPSDRKVKKLMTGNYHTCFLLDDASMWCCGANFYGQVNWGTSFCATSDPVSQYDTPQQITTDVQDMFVGGNHNCFEKTDGSISCWGKNYYGQIGNSYPSYCTQPHQIFP